MPTQRELSRRFSVREMMKDRPFYGPAIHRAAFTLDPGIKAVLGV